MYKHLSDIQTTSIECKDVHRSLRNKDIYTVCAMNAPNIKTANKNGIRV